MVLMESPPSTCAFFNIRRASRAVSHLYDLVLAPQGVKASQFVILRAIGESGRISHSELALRFAASIETFSRRLASARSAGWVQMQLADRGRRIYSLTAKGQKLVQDLTPEWERAQQRLKQSLGEEDWESLAGFASRLTEAALRAELAPASNGKKS